MKKTLVVVIMLAFGGNIFAQSRIPNSESNTEQKEESKKTKPKKSFWENVILEPQIGLSFGNVVAVEVSPFMYYRVNKNFQVGGGTTFQYFSVPNTIAIDYGTNIEYRDVRMSLFNVGPKIGARYFLMNQWYFSGEMQYLFVTEKVNNIDDLVRQGLTSNKNSYNFPVGFLGVGYSSSLFGNGFNIRLMYELFNNPNSPYSGSNIGMNRLWLTTSFGFGSVN